MCYSDFGDIMEHIQAMDADVLLIEAARSRMELLHDWEKTGYTNDIGPGVYDIHSPRVPPAEEMAELLRAAARVLKPEQLWVNPDCGLKTRAGPRPSRACATWWTPPASSARSSSRRPSSCRSAAVEICAAALPAILRPICRSSGRGRTI